MGIEPTPQAWKANMLNHYTIPAHKNHRIGNKRTTLQNQTYCLVKNNLRIKLKPKPKVFNNLFGFPNKKSLKQIKKKI
jgi:hypothetical protein